MEEYGCSMPEDKFSSFKETVEQFQTQIDAAKGFMPNQDFVVDKAIDLVMSWIEGLFGLISLLTADTREQLDEYCTGMAFGLQGSKILVNVANIIHKGKNGSNTGKNGFFKNLSENLISMMDGSSDEL